MVSKEYMGAGILKVRIICASHSFSFTWMLAASFLTASFLAEWDAQRDSKYVRVSVCLSGPVCALCMSVCVCLCVYLSVCRCTWVSEEVHVFVCVVWIYDFASECRFVGEFVGGYVLVLFCKLVCSWQWRSKEEGGGEGAVRPWQLALPSSLWGGQHFSFPSLGGGQLFVLCCDKEKQQKLRLRCKQQRSYLRSLVGGSFSYL